MFKTILCVEKFVYNLWFNKTFFKSLNAFRKYLFNTSLNIGDIEMKNVIFVLKKPTV